ncbi:MULTISPECIES: hypothetical protein [Salipiger]|jgi:hypothetical protein|uniref:Uncharacterized protein n=1 Tax=Salipiger profundus TaxID=1229727 RepID=A0A1U7D0J7_9RHOB|nr:MULTISPECIES: hypothetical protein [Salipiger]APX21638.1 hypothetical protein Ga0080559_TMP842 [Salipiger profundus]GGA00970.1 hypothetical protein GCM10011326_10160 [Salipiger profundus]SFC12346.1 hypothetical protein SAMN05444415_102171 [Salipiger profundus]|tara:strand:+ start:467 stop:625 length:159 start_codon:yes stop_codon:yes gene_type:complete
MERKSGQQKTTKNDRDARLKAALKANLARRKAQAKARTSQDDEADTSSEKDR